MYIGVSLLLQALIGSLYDLNTQWLTSTVYILTLWPTWHQHRIKKVFSLCYMNFLTIHLSYSAHLQ